jgi:hypothetical protein
MRTDFTERLLRAAPPAPSLRAIGHVIALALALTGCSDDAGITGASASQTTEGEATGESEGATTGGTSAGPASDTATTNTGTSPSTTEGETSESSDTDDATTEPAPPLVVECGGPPSGALGASYEHFLVGSGGTAPYNWQISGLPPGLDYLSFSGKIFGTPTELGAFDLQITLTDAKGLVELDACTLKIDEPLSLDLEGFPSPCLTKDQTVLSYLSGGNGSPIVCSVPGGEGNGKLPAGLAIDEDDCTIKGAITELNYGTWAWIVAATQDGVSVYAPYCATQGLQLPQSHSITATHAGGDQLDPATGTFAPGEPIKFDGDAEPLFEITGCGGPPCYHETLVFFTASPFGGGACEDDADGCVGICPLVPDGMEPDGDKQLPCNLLDGFQGLEHELWAKGDAVPAAFEDRPWIAQHTFHYCLGNSPNYCAGGLDAIKEKGNNTNLEFAIIMWPE